MSNLDQVSSEETPPKAGAMINTFRAFGYNLCTAIADIIDNSISAKAENIWVNYFWAGNESWVSILDDGVGMDRAALVEAMTPGSKNPNEEREEHDLGRFGLGLKTSSFSQCKSLTVITKKEDFKIIQRCWDLDYVNKTGKWLLLDYLSDASFSNDLENFPSGTKVLWQNLDRLVGNAHVQNEAARIVFLEEFEKVEHHLSLIFHRYMEKNRLNIYMNGEKLEPWDPFMKGVEGGQLLTTESLDQDKILVKCYVLPHISKMTIDERLRARSEEWYQLQGFYIYRRNRLLLHGDWLSLFPKNEQYKNARILVDIPNELDHSWKIDIKKASATPALNVRKDLIRLGKLTRKSAGKVYRHRGNEVMLEESENSFNFQPLWKARKERDGSRFYSIDQKHPVVKSILEKDMVNSREIKSLLKLIGETTPVESIIQFHSEDPESHEIREKKEVDPGVVELAQKMYSSLVSTGMSSKLAANQIFNIEPFNKYPQLIQYFN